MRIVYKVLRVDYTPAALVADRPLIGVGLGFVAGSVVGQLLVIPWLAVRSLRFTARFMFGLVGRSIGVMLIALAPQPVAHWVAPISAVPVAILSLSVTGLVFWRTVLSSAERVAVSELARALVRRPLG